MSDVYVEVTAPRSREFIVISVMSGWRTYAYSLVEPRIIDPSLKFRIRMGPTYGWVFRGPQFWHHGGRADHDQALIKNVGIRANP